MVLFVCILRLFQEVKHKILFLVDMLPVPDPVIDLAIARFEEHNILKMYLRLLLKNKKAVDDCPQCDSYLVQKTVVLPSLEYE